MVFSEFLKSTGGVLSTEFVASNSASSVSSSGIHVAVSSAKMENAGCIVHWN